MVVQFSCIDSVVCEKLNNFFPGKKNLIEANPGHILLPQKYEELWERIENFQIRDDDVWLVSYPRTGSTWALEMVWLLGSKLDYEGAKKNLLIQRAPFMDLTAICGNDNFQWVNDNVGNSIDYLDRLPSPRFCRSHLTWPLLPHQINEKKPKLIYTVRNPKDVCVSYYHYCKLLHGMEGPFDEFCQLFIDGNVPFGSYLGHVLPYWEHRNDPNILFLKYETMKKDLPTVVKKCAEFLELEIKIDSAQLEKICSHLNFDMMRVNPAVNYKPIFGEGIADDPTSDKKFIRKGEIGDWKNHMSSGMSLKFDKWIKETTRGTGLEFEYE